MDIEDNKIDKIASDVAVGHDSDEKSSNKDKMSDGKVSLTVEEDKLNRNKNRNRFGFDDEG